MILSSADILRVLGGDPVVRQEARLSVVDGKPGIGYDEFVYIYIDKYPATDEFEATWKIWVVDGGSAVYDLVVEALYRLLPNFKLEGGIASVTDFLTPQTETRPVESVIKKEAAATISSLEARFEQLVEDVQDRMLLVGPGRPGKDGADGRDGRDGRDGKDGRDGQDLAATEAELFDLKDVEQGITLERGQVLTWDGTQWTNLYVPRTLSSGGGGSSGGTTINSIDDLSDVDTSTSPPSSGEFLQWDGFNWVPGTAASDADGGDFGELPNPDGGNFETGATLSTLAYPVDGGDFDSGTTTAYGDSLFDGGVAT